MKHLIVLASVLSIAACAKKETVPANTAAAATRPAQTASAETMATDGAALNNNGAQSKDMFGAKEADGLLVVNFPYDSATLTPEAQEKLRNNADYLQANPTARIVVEGHTDERGADEYNLALGERRAKAVRDYLSLLGIDGSRLKTVSYGAEQPLDMEHDEDAWAKNRRAQFREASN